MPSSARFAFALLLWWLACLCFFVAFHPGGVQVNGHPAQNPADVIKYMMQKMGNPAGSGTQSPGGTTNA